MFRALAAAIRAALKRMKSFVWKTVEVGGRMISMLVPAPSSPAEIDPQGGDLPDPATLIEAPICDDVRIAAGELAQGHRIPDGLRLSDLQRRWLECMPRLMLCRVLSAEDTAINRAAHGIEALPKVVHCHADDIADYVAASKRAEIAAASQPVNDYDAALAGLGYVH